MEDKSNRSSILLTYKGKVLLMNKSNGPLDSEKHPWYFIAGACEASESVENALARRIKKEMGIRIEAQNVEFVEENCYHARLTDDNVNNIERSDNQLLDFFSLKEVENLTLSQSTRQFISNHQELIG